MGFLDRFKPKREKIGKEKKPKHVVAKGAKERADEELHRQFAAVPSASMPVVKSEKAKGDDHERAAGRVIPKERSKPSAKRRMDTGDAYRILLRPLVSEKATAIMAQQHYVFVVSPSANKIAVRRAIESLYGVRPQKVNVINVRGKHLRYGRTEGQTKDWRKAIVTLQPGEKLDVYGA